MESVIDAETAIDSGADFERVFEEALMTVPDEHFDRDCFVPGVGPPTRPSS